MRCTRRAWLAATLAGCADVPAPAPAAPQPLLAPRQRIGGGFLAAPGGPTRSYVRFVRPHAVAVRGLDMLVADLAQQRLWRVDVAAGTLAGVAGVALSPQTALLLGADGSAWVLDAAAGQVLRFGRDGRLLQTWRPGGALPSPVGVALADQGATLLVADGLGAQWSEQRGPGALVRLVQPQHADGRRITGVDAVAMLGNEVAVLDRLACAVHVVSRAGVVQRTLGQGELAQPVALAADRRGRCFVLESTGAVKLLVHDQPVRTLALPQAAALAADGDQLVAVDTLRADAVLYRLGAGP